jgi:acyl-CoA synthetase (AMP-forming)/AMP-acid ligase II
MNWFEQIAFQAKLGPDEPAVVFPGGMATYGALVGCVEAASQHVLRLGLKKGQIVALEIRHPLLHLVIILALHRCGIASFTLQTSYLIQQANLSVDKLLSDRYQEPGNQSKLTLVSNDWLVAPKDNAAPVSPGGFDSPDDVCRLVLSSGTTGAPKVISVTERNLEYRFARSAILLERGRYLSMMGFSTLGGYQTLMSALVLGGTICFAGAPEDVLQVIALYHVTHLIAAPFQVRSLLESQAKSGLNLPSLRHVFLAGSRLETSLLAQVRAQLCPNAICAYGSTELGPVAYGPASAMREIEGATGFVMPGETIEIVGKDGAPLPPGEEGVVRIKTASIRCYFVPTPDDAEIFRDGWFYPGDVGKLMPDGLLVITGRVNEIINRGGDKLAPEVIEAVLRLIPEISDAAVFAVPNTDQIWAAVVATGMLKPEAILAFCQQKLAGMAPDRIFELDRIPRNDMGKIIREEMREAIMKKLASSFMTS